MSFEYKLTFLNIYKTNKIWPEYWGGGGVLVVEGKLVSSLSEQNRSTIPTGYKAASIRVAHVDVSVPKDTALIPRPKGPDISVG